MGKEFEIIVTKKDEKGNAIGVEVKMPEEKKHDKPAKKAEE